MNMHPGVRHWICALILCGCGFAAHSQSLDYGALEQLFREPVTTSITGTPQRVSEVPGKIVIVTAEDIRRSGAHDIPGLLRHVSGIDVMSWTNDGADVGVRGYDQANSPGLLVLIDGRQVQADHNGNTPWSALPVELAAIRQIELVKGPSAALFGFNAVYGVINIVTYNPLYDDINNVSVSAGTHDLVEGSAVGTFRFSDRAALQISGGSRSNQDFSTPIPVLIPGATATRRPDDRLAFNIDGALRLGTATELSVELSHADVNEDGISPLYSLSRDRFRTASAKLQLNSDTELGLLQATAYTNSIDQASLPGFANLPVTFNNRLTVVQLQDVFGVGTSHSLRLSAEYRHSAVNTAPITGGRIFYDVMTGGGNWTWKISPAVSLSNAVRFDSLRLGRSGFVPAGFPFSNADWNRTLDNFSFNSGVVWKVNDTDRLRFTVARGSQLPGLSLLGGVLANTPSINYSGFPFLQPTHVTNDEVGWDHALPALNTVLKISAFHIENQGLLSPFGGFTAAAGVAYVGPSNVGDSSANGVEIGFRASFRQYWRWGALYRFEHIVDHFTLGAQQGTRFVDFQHVTPQHMVTANAGWSKARWDIDGYFRYQSATRGLQPAPSGLVSVLVPVNAYVSVDARLAFRLARRVSLSLSGQNLLHATQQQTSGPDVERRVIVTLSADL